MHENIGINLNFTHDNFFNIISSTQNGNYVNNYNEFVMNSIWSCVTDCMLADFNIIIKADSLIL